MKIIQSNRSAIIKVFYNIGSLVCQFHWMKLNANPSTPSSAASSSCFSFISFVNNI